MTLETQARNSQIKLRAVVLRTLIGLWPVLDVNRLDATFPTWALSVGQLVIGQHATSVQLAAEYLRAARFASGVTGTPTIVRATPPPAEQLAAALRVTSLVAVKRGMLAGQTSQTAMRNAFVQSSGAASRMVLNGGRDTVTGSIQADPAVTHFKRVTTARPCFFCAMLASRGPVYKTAESAGSITRYHDHCSCIIAPVYGNQDSWDPQTRKLRELWQSSTEGKSGPAARDAFREAFANAHL